MTRRTYRFVVFGLMVVAAFARLWQITAYPPGLFPDQAANGEDALAILRGDLQPFYERGNGREALFFYLQAASIAVFGIGVWPMFFASALVGIATVWVSYLAARRLFGREVALFTLAFMATNPWHVTISRTGFRAIMMPLFLALTAYFLAGIAESKTPGRRILNALGAGLSYGLGWYTYIAYRASLGILFLLGVLGFVHDGLQRPRFRGLRRVGGSLLIALLAACVVLVPLTLYFLNHPGAFLGRAAQVSFLSSGDGEQHVVQEFSRVLSDSIRAFFTRGDHNPRHNVPAFPFLSPLAALFFGLGFLVVLRRTGQHVHRLFHGRRAWTTFPYVAVLLWLPLMLLPAVTTNEGIPHGLRSIGEIPAVFWISGIGAAWGITRIRTFPSLAARTFTFLFLGAAVCLTFALDLGLYFGVTAHSPRAWEEYRADLTTVSQYLHERKVAGAPSAFLVLDAFSEQTVHFLTTHDGYPYRLVKPEESERQELAPDDVIIFTRSTLADVERYLRAHPDVAEIKRHVNRVGQLEMRVFAAPGNDS